MSDSEVSENGLSASIPVIQKPLSNLRSEILENLPSIMKQRQCCSKSSGTKLNSLLLEYFIQSELTKISTSENTSSSNESKESTITKEEAKLVSDDKDTSSGGGETDQKEDPNNKDINNSA